MDSVMAARALEARYPDLAVTVADARFMKPLDEDLIRSLANERWLKHISHNLIHQQHTRANILLHDIIPTTFSPSRSVPKKNIPVKKYPCFFFAYLCISLSRSDVLVTIEEGSKGGFGDHVLHFLAQEGTSASHTSVIQTVGPSEEFRPYHNSSYPPHTPRTLTHPSTPSQSIP